MSFNELNWVEFLKKKAKRAKGIFAGIGDDCAVIKEKGKYYLISSDLFIEDVHFRLKNISFTDIGRRAAARAVSDIAACCGAPMFIIVSAGIPSFIKARQMKEIAKGIEDTASKCCASVIGGDTSRAQRLFLDIWVMGRAEKPILRKTAKTGDYVFLTGKLGKLAFNKPFMPKLKEARYLANNFRVNAMIDISDGFIIDLYRILQASAKGALLHKEEIPVTHGDKDLYRGEDYELIFTVDKNEPKIELLKRKFYWVGYIREKSFGYYFGFYDSRRKGSKKKEKVKVRGYLHFYS